MNHHQGTGPVNMPKRIEAAAIRLIGMSEIEAAREQHLAEVEAGKEERIALAKAQCAERREKRMAKENEVKE